MEQNFNFETNSEAISVSNFGMLTLNSNWYNNVELKITEKCTNGALSESTTSITELKPNLQPS